MSPGGHTAGVSRAYGARADEYAELFGTVDAADTADRTLIGEGAASIDGPLLDAGCGPGHWTAFLTANGFEAEGIDATEEFIAIARRAHPGLGFRCGDIATLADGPQRYDGILVWYSLIHQPPASLPGSLTAVRSALRPGGSLLIGFFAGERTQPFDHAVTRAWCWRPDELSDLVTDTGFEVKEMATRPVSANRTHGHLLAVKI